MARPIKHGLDYFPFDVDFFSDEKLYAISGEFGIKGEITTIKLLCAVYRNGYYIEWTEMLKFKLLKELPGVSPDLLDQIIKRLVKWDFFDKDLFDSASILTSRGIQRRYQTISAKMHRKNEISEYCLLDIPTAQETPPKSKPKRLAQPAPTPVTDAPATVIAKSHPIPIDESIGAMLSDSIWSEPVCKRYNLTPEELKQKIANFRLHCLSREKREHDDVTDAKRHFCNLLSQGKLNDIDSPSANKPLSHSTPTASSSRKGLSSKPHIPDPERERFRRLVPQCPPGTFIISPLQYDAFGMSSWSEDQIKDYCHRILDGTISPPSLKDIINKKCQPPTPR